jgi:hypothetical protein
MSSSGAKRICVGFCDRTQMYYNKVRTHRSLDKDAPIWRPVQRTGVITSNPILGGLHHHTSVRYTQSLAPTVTGALCSVFDSLRDHVGPAGSSEPQHKVNDLRLPLWSWCEAQSLEQLQHRSVFRQHVRHQFLEP